MTGALQGREKRPRITEKQQGAVVVMAASTSTSLRPRSSAPRLARNLVRDLCSRSRLPEYLVDNAVLVTSELVTRTVMHARKAVDVVVELDEDHVTVRIHDQTVMPPLLGGDWVSGPSRAIIERLSTSWGYHCSDTGRDIWASVGTDSYRKN